ncbi:HxlR family transcriptional regulator [Epilithonimonas arachidiradicis]|uniref:HxlR family transcriptional regulator n=2 Tax=Epilithonimonas arachidiradicis TaxID=1617282 RepID=A0A420DBV2_9FLAO|nr:HxlR family transcriptional regulator [Epilithonimonas arachidiradicis]
MSNKVTMDCKDFKDEHKKEIMAVHDAMDVLSGKWKISIISSICYYNKRRFSDILNDVEGISNRMLSKELKDLEMNKLLERTVLHTKPISVQYQLTDYGLKLKNIINNLSEWGAEHRKVIIGK